MVRTRIVLAASVLALASANAWAQSNDAVNVDNARKTARVHVGPFYVNPVVLLRDMGIDTNVFNAAGDQKSDFTLTLTPQSDVAVPIARRGLLQATAGVDFVYYATYATERSLDPHLRVRGEGYFRRLTLFAENAYVNSRQRPNFEIDVRSRHRDNDLTAGVKIHMTHKLSADLAAERAEARYDAGAVFDGTVLQQTLNRTSSGLVGSVRDRLTPLTTIGVRFDRLADRFAYSPLRDSRSYRVMPGVEFNPRALISGRAWVGYRKFTPEQAGTLPEFSGLVADVGLSYTLLGATTIGAGCRRDLTYSYEVAQPFFVDTSVGASIRRALGGRFDTVLSLDRHRYAYRDAGGAPVLPAGLRVDTTWVYGANVGYRIRRDARVGIGANYYSRDSNRATFVRYDGLRIGATLTNGF